MWVQHSLRSLNKNSRRLTAAGAAAGRPGRRCLPAIGIGIGGVDRSRRVRRRGISLLEVLISIFVFLVGVLGVAALLPLANHQATRGAIADRAGELGRRAHREFRIRGMNLKTNWRYGDNTPINFSGLPPEQSFAIDPRFLAVDPAYPTNSAERKFPYTSGASPFMARVTLIDTTNSPMSRILADELFMAQDDLSIFVPDDGESAPVQMDTTGYDPGSGQIYPWTDIITAGGTPTKRQSDGRFSWMATLVPLIDSDVPADLHTLSIVVFYQRDLSMGTTPENERVVEIDFIGGGLSGGDVILRSTTVATDLEIKPGQWIMAGRRFSAGASFLDHFRWYRVIATEEEIQGTGPWTRNITLAGPDWINGDPKWNPIAPPQATIVEGVVAVYEKTIRLDTSSLWSN